MNRFLSFLLIWWVSTSPATATGDEVPSPDFDKTIAPLIARRCLDCHSGSEPKGGLNLAFRKTAFAGGDDGVVLVSGQPDKSRLWQLVNKGKMPPKKPLPAAEKELIKQWIAAGGKWGSDPIDPFRVTTELRAGYDWWALQPVVRPKLPAVKDAKWPRQPVDAFILHDLEAKGLHPSPEADQRTLIRRLSFDLLGLPPEPGEVETFLKDPDPDAYAKVVERYLASPQYGVRWARHWLDIVRFGESNGFEFDEFRPNAWPYRDWVVDALNRDMPFTEFARFQLAGDVLHPQDPDAVRATGFLVAGAYDMAGQTQQSEAMRKVVRQDELEDLTGTIGQTFLGLTVNCARCHDHKFDPIKQVEYYSLTAALAGVRHGERALPVPQNLAYAVNRNVALKEELIAAIESAARRRILGDRPQKPVQPAKPLASWDFAESFKDSIGQLHGTARGTVTLKGGVRFDGKSYVNTISLKRDLKAKTLEAWVALENLDQRGGGVIGVQAKDGSRFDAIVFGEKEPRCWMAGSEGFNRYQPFKGPPESERDLVHIAIVYEDDGTIAAYRNGRPYGEPYKSSGLATFTAGECEIVFGMRHTPAGGNKMLSGTIHKAQLYDRSLNPAEIAASAGVSSDYVPPEEITAELTAEQKSRREQLRSEIKKEKERLPGTIYAVVPRQPETAHLLVRGNPAHPGQPVSAAGVKAVAGVSPQFGLGTDAPEGERRVKLAGWICDPKNPLFSRVIVNRLWHYHFGVGLVDTPNDFGFNGGRPVHPELLDWLAAEFREQKGSLKQLHRMMVLSAAYRQSSQSNADGMRVDAINRLVWRKSPVRLEAEAVRDATLAVSGRLDLHLGGPGFPEYQAVKAEGTNTYLYQLIDPTGENFTRRTLYRNWSRGGRSRFLDVLDCPDPSTTTPSRVVTTTPLQALSLLNHAFVLNYADRFAERLARTASSDPDQQIIRAYELAFARPPKTEELAIARKVVAKHGLAVLARAIFNSNEFLYVD